ncbi:MAG: hypothetical protein HEQ39_04185 [Rhizobacter sp.]
MHFRPILAMAALVLLALDGHHAKRWAHQSGGFGVDDFQDEEATAAQAMP